MLARTSMHRVREQKAKKLPLLAELVICQSRCRFRHAALGPLSTARQRRQTKGKC